MRKHPDLKPQLCSPIRRGMAVSTTGATTSRRESGWRLRRSRRTGPVGPLLAVGLLVGRSTPRPLLTAPGHPHQANAEVAQIHVRDCISMAREQLAGAGERWNLVESALLRTLVTGLIGAGTAALYALGRDDTAMVAARGSIGGSALGLAMGSWWASSEFEAGFKSRVSECVWEREYRIRGWD